MAKMAKKTRKTRKTRKTKKTRKARVKITNGMRLMADKMHKDGKTAKVIAAKLDISYAAVLSILKTTRNGKPAVTPALAASNTHELVTWISEGLQLGFLRPVSLTDGVLRVELAAAPHT